MNTMTKKWTLLMLAVLTLVMSIFVPLNKASAATTYNNTNRANLYASVSSNGRLSASLSVLGIKGITTKIEVSLYVEKRILGLFWSRVDIGCDDNVWEDSTTNYYYNNTFSCDLSSTGTYRVTVTYTVSGTGGASDVITKTDTVTY
ncbi:MAG: hypothetical protein J5544_03775 [Clostridia bacterium]|nr:hypothetical protein [Clostridia bacterium]